MRQLIKTACILILGVLLINNMQIAYAEKNVYYVSAGVGSDLNDGSANSPFKTIQKAADMAQPGDDVIIRGGIYRETVIPKHSGKAGLPITYKAYPGEKVVINGCDVVSGFMYASGVGQNIYSANMNWYFTEGNQSNQVFQDGKMMQLARYPNIGDDVNRPIKATVDRFISKTRDKSTNWTTGVIEDFSLGDKSNDFYTGAEIYFQPNNNAWSWTFSGEVISHKGNNLSFRTRNDSGADGNSSYYPEGSRYFLYNSLNLLDSNGEWYIDKTARKIYLRTLEGDDPNSHIIEAKRRQYGFDLSNLSYINIQGIEFFACTVTTDNIAGGLNAKGYDENGNTIYPWRGANMGIAAASYITLDNLSVLYPTHFTDVSGHFFMQWGQNSGVIISGTNITLQNSVIRYSAGNGVSVLGKNNRILHNVIMDINYITAGYAGINFASAAITQDHEVGYNTIRRAGRDGIAVRGLKNSDANQLKARIHHNDVSECMLQDWDGGALYGALDNGNFLRIDHNKFHNTAGYTASGAYLDFSKNVIIDHNVIYDVEWGIHLQGSAGTDLGGYVNNTLCYNNTVVVKNTSNAPFGPFGFANTAANNSSNNGTVISNNLVLIDDSYIFGASSSRGYKPISDNFENAAKRNNLLYNGNQNSQGAGFLNFSRRDFALTEASEAVDKGEQIDFDTVTDGSETYTLPRFMGKKCGGLYDIGAYEYGTDAWNAGHIKDLTLSSMRLASNAGPDFGIGILGAENSVGETTYSLVDGYGSDDNSLFKISDGVLKTAADLTLHNKAEYNIRVEARDGEGAVFQKTFNLVPHSAADAVQILKAGFYINGNTPAGSVEELAAFCQQGNAVARVYYNDSGNGGSAVIIAAGFKDGVLEFSHLMPFVEDEACANIVKSKDVILDLTGYELKNMKLCIYVFDGMGSIRPIFDVVCIE